jgi:hypothetical protein
MFVAVTVLGTALAWIGWQAKIVQDRRLMLDWVMENGGWGVGTEGRHKISLIRRWLGDKPHGQMFHLPESMDKARKEDFCRLFPEAIVQ